MVAGASYCSHCKKREAGRPIAIDETTAKLLEEIERTVSLQLYPRDMPSPPTFRLSNHRNEGSLLHVKFILHSHVALHEQKIYMGSSAILD